MRDRHVFISGDEIRQPPVFFVGATASPFAVPMEADVKKTVEKAAAGADFLQTQPVFDVEGFGVWLRTIRAAGAAKVAIIAGVLILRSGDQAERMAKIPGVAVPAAVVERMRAAADAEREGVAIAAETIAKLRAQGGAQGVHLYAIEWPEAIPLTVDRAGLFPRPRRERGPARRSRIPRNEPRRAAAYRAYSSRISRRNGTLAFFRRSSNASKSHSPTNVTATPLLPIRPVRPTRCVKVSASSGRSSSPRGSRRRCGCRDATFVAMRIGRSPARNMSSVRSRSRWLSLRGWPPPCGRAA